MKIAVYAIAKNEAAHAERWMAAVADADLVLVADTGSSDDTVALLRKAGAVVEEIVVEPWRFDIARNRTLELLPEDLDACFSLDLDDVVQPGWRKAVEAAWKPAVTCLSYDFVLTHTADGQPDSVYTTTKIHARRGYHWEHAVHEVVVPNDPAGHVVVPCEVRVDHYPDETKSRGGYVPLLELVRDEEPESYRHAFWLGIEYFNAERYEETIAELNRALALPSASWRKHRSEMMRLIAQASAALGRPGEVERWRLRACAETPDDAGTWVELAQGWHNAADWAGGNFAARRALLATDDGLWHRRAEDLASVCSWRLGAHDAAREHVAAAQRMAPADSRILANARLMGAEDGADVAAVTSPFGSAFTGPVMSARNPEPRLLSVTLTGNAEDLIGDALRSVVDWVAACIVLNTGATDGTLAAARAVAGHKYVERGFPWVDDFAAARNFALAAAHELGADWAVMLDTDERIHSGGEDIIGILAGAAEDVLTVAHEGGYYAKERFFRLPAKGRYVGLTHEAFVADGAEYRLLPGIRFAEVGKSREDYRQKFERDAALLAEEIRRHPDDPRWHYYLGDAQQNLGRFEEAIAAYRTSASLKGWNEQAAWACYRAAECWLSLGDEEQAIESCAAGLARHAGIAELAWLAAFASWQGERFHQAIDWAHMSVAMGRFRGRGGEVQRLGFRNPHALYEGPYDVLRFALRAVGERAAADEAERLYQEAAAARQRET